MFYLGAYTQDVQFNGAAAAELVEEFRSTATELGRQIGDRTQLSAAARELWEGWYARQFDGEIRICIRDAQRFIPSMQTAAAQLEQLAMLARQEQQRRLLARQWVMQLAAYAAAGLPPPPPPPTVTPPIEPPSISVVDSPPMQRSPFTLTGGGTGQSSADPDHLDRWVNASGGLDGTLSSRQVALEGHHDVFRSTSRWGNFDASALIGSFRTYIRYNQEDALWTAMIAGSFRSADSSGGVVSQPDGKIAEALWPGSTGARQPYKPTTRTNEQLALDRDPTPRPGETPQQAQTRAQAAQEEIAMREAVRVYEALGERPPRVNVRVNDAANPGMAHTIERHGPQIPLDGPPGSHTVKGRIYGAAPWANPASFSFKWINESTMNRTVNNYLTNNWKAIRADLAFEGKHERTFNTGNLIGEGFFNHSYATSARPNAGYSRTSIVTITIKLIPGTSPPAFAIIRAFPNYRGSVG